jgi:hypothetical protein
MNKITTPTKLLVGSFILIVWLVNILPKKRAQSNLIPSLKAQKSPTCDQTTVTGTYGFSGQGVFGFGSSRRWRVADRIRAPPVVCSAPG